MSLPTVDQYNEAVQHPQTAFTDPDLKMAQAKTNAFGIPQALGGGFALTYTFTGAQGKKWAVRCFHKAVQGLNERYATVSRTLNSLNSPYFVDFAYQSQGIRVNSALHPIVKMAWVEGETLGSYLDRIYRDKTRLQTLRQQFRQLESFLRRQNIAHGDLQNGNVMVGRDVRLIDYDGLYVPGLPTGQGTELGHRHFQHPRRQARDHGPLLDRFSFISIDLSLQAVAEQPDLFKRFSNGENILFNANDYLEPDSSKVFTALREIPTLKPAVERFAQICRQPVADIPTLEEFVKPTTALRAAPTPTSARRNQQPVCYLGAFDVLDATNFARGMEFVGQRVELIGKITEVCKDQTRTPQPRPYVFINFGDWRKKILKIAIWSEGLANLSEEHHPQNFWIGRWISVTGLLDPPYSNPRFGYTHLSVTVTESNQMRLIDEQEAKWRLASIGQPLPDLPPTASPPRPEPKPELKVVLKPELSSQPPQPKPSPPSTPVSSNTAEVRRRNQEVLGQIRASTAAQPASTHTPTLQTVTPTSRPEMAGDFIDCPNCGTRNRVKTHSSHLNPICRQCLSSLKPQPVPPQPKPVPPKVTPAPSPPPAPTSTWQQPNPIPANTTIPAIEPIPVVPSSHQDQQRYINKPYPLQTPNDRSSSGIPAWLWIVIGVLILWILVVFSGSNSNQPSRSSSSSLPPAASPPTLSNSLPSESSEVQKVETIPSTQPTDQPKTDKPRATKRSLNKQPKKRVPSRKPTPVKELESQWKRLM